MDGKLQRLFLVLLAVFLFLFVLSNFNFVTFSINLDNWIEYVLIVLFYILLFQFWKMVQRYHQQEVLQASITDPLSKLYNSQHFFSILEAEIERSRRHNRPVSSLYLDIDYFHRYNETRGLKAGDKVLAFLGELILNSTRKYDSGFRFGNDEYGLVLPETDRTGARIIAERIRDGFAQTYRGEVSLSVGIATLDDQDNVDRMVRKCEAAMDEARRGGGDRIRAYIERGQL